MRLKQQRAGWIVLPCMALGALGGLGISFLMKPVFESAAVLRLMPEESRFEFMRDSMKSLDSRELPAKLIAAADLYPEERRTQPPEVVEDKVRRGIALADAPRPARRPVFPNRPAFVTLGLFTGLIAALLVLLLRGRLPPPGLQSA